MWSLRKFGLQSDTSEKVRQQSSKYITVLYRLVETCEYGDLRNEMLCGRIVEGLPYQTLSEKLQMDANLTLYRAKGPYCKKKR